MKSKIEELFEKYDEARGLIQPTIPSMKEMVRHADPDTPFAWALWQTDGRGGYLKNPKIVFSELDMLEAINDYTVDIQALYVRPKLSTKS